MVKKYIDGPDGEPVPVHEVDISHEVANLCAAFELDPAHVLKIEITPKVAVLQVANVNDNGSKHVVLDEERSDYGLLDMRLERFTVRT